MASFLADIDELLTFDFMSVPGLYFEAQAYEQLRNLLNENSFSKVLILVDSNTHELCLPHFMSQLKVQLANLEIVELEPGEDSKSIEVLANLWDTFGALALDRKSLLINLGGGVISDLGGFAAATYMRGIAFVNFPTSLLAMADAAVGSKTGINFGGFKNRIGLFTDPVFVGIDPQFLETLEEGELLSGWAEMLKHAMLTSGESLRKLLIYLKAGDLPSLNQIEETIAVKHRVVEKDKLEKGLRKILNFGHSVGHALESYFQIMGQAISHGHAIALGMQVELSLSSKILGFDEKLASSLIAELNAIYAWPQAPVSQDHFMQLLAGDKKNEAQQAKLVLLKDLGEPQIDVKVEANLIWDTLEEIKGG